MLKRFGGVNMNPIIKILMERDEMSKQEATELYNQVQEMIMENPMEAEEIKIDFQYINNNLNSFKAEKVSVYYE